MDYYAAIVLIGSLSLLVAIAGISGNILMKKQKKRLFQIMFALIIVTNVSEWLAAALNSVHTELTALHTAAKFTEMLLTPIIPFVGILILGIFRNITAYLFIPSAVNIVLQLVSLFNGCIFTVNSDSVYSRGPLYIVYTLTYVTQVIILGVCCIKFSKTYQYSNHAFLSMLTVLLVIAVALPFINHELRLDWTCISFTSLIFYIYYNQLAQQVDPATTLLNRRSLDNSLTKLHKKTAIIFMDVDGFKNINDKYGHGFGDECLLLLSKELKKTFKTGYCYRFGGDESCVLLTKNPDSAENLISAYKARLDILRKSNPNLPHISAGCTVYDPALETVENAFQRADELMYEKKRAKHA